MFNLLVQVINAKLSQIIGLQLGYVMEPIKKFPICKVPSGWEKIVLMNRNMKL